MTKKTVERLALNNGYIFKMAELLEQYSNKEIQEGIIDFADTVQYIKNYATKNKQILADLRQELKARKW